MAFIHNILNAGDNSHNGTVRKQRKSLSMGLKDTRTEAGMSRPVWGKDMVVRCPPPPHKSIKTNRKALVHRHLAKKRSHKVRAWKGERSSNRTPQVQEWEMLSLETAWHHCTQKPAWWWDDSRSCIGVQTGKRKIPWDDSGWFWRRKHYPPLGHVHKLIPWQNPTAQTISGCIWPILNTGFVRGYRAPRY